MFCRVADAELAHVPRASARMCRAVEHPEHRAEDAGLAFLAAEEQVVGDVEAGRDRQGLVDGLDAGGAGVHRRAEMHRLAVEEDLAAVRDQRAGQRLDQAGLAGAVVADHREDLAGVELEVAAVERGDDPAVALDQALRLQDRVVAVVMSSPS
jgi:hypothetical protein